MQLEIATPRVFVPLLGGGKRYLDAAAVNARPNRAYLKAAVCAHVNGIIDKRRARACGLFASCISRGFASTTEPAKP
jgi:hypothetical protein